ncbi:MAG: hypothetical protein GKS06_02185 [Acidobacteria bacterium]|nr:hypothetical protein [Acidobacteriota bacterium]
MRYRSLLLLVLALFVSGTATAQATEILGTLGKLGISPTQALGGAQALLGVAQSNLGGDEFSALMGAAPELKQVMDLTDMAGSVGSMMGGASASASAGADASASAEMPALPAGVGSLDALANNAGLVSQFGDLGLDAGMITKFAPVLLHVASKAGPETLGLLTKGLGIG